MQRGTVGRGRQSASHRFCACGHSTASLLHARVKLRVDVPEPSKDNLQHSERKKKVACDTTCDYRGLHWHVTVCVGTLMVFQCFSGWHVTIGVFIRSIGSCWTWLTWFVVVLTWHDALHGIDRWGSTAEILILHQVPGGLCVGRQVLEVWVLADSGRLE